MWSTESPPADLHGLGSVLLAVDRLAAAERPLLAAAAASPGFWEPHLGLGALYQRLGMRGAALQAFRNAHALAPDHPDLAGLTDAPAH
jgi:Flp pilus assembly protein TadD